MKPAATQTKSACADYRKYRYFDAENAVLAIRRVSVGTGGTGNDSLRGGKGNDTLDGYGGSVNEVDTLVGGAGADIFRLGVEQASRIFYRENGDSYAIITDFSRPEGDKIDILGSSSNFSQYSFTQSGTNTQIVYQNDLIAVVQNSIATSFTQSDFI